MLHNPERPFPIACGWSRGADGSPTCTMTSTSEGLFLRRASCATSARLWAALTLKKGSTCTQRGQRSWGTAGGYGTEQVPDREETNKITENGQWQKLVSEQQGGFSDPLLALAKQQLSQLEAVRSGHPARRERGQNPTHADGGSSTAEARTAHCWLGTLIPVFPLCNVSAYINGQIANEIGPHLSGSHSTNSLQARSKCQSFHSMFFNGY
jgi:hypothetical protein